MPSDLQRSHDELRAALWIAGKEVRKLNFGRKDSEVLKLLRRVVRDSGGITVRLVRLIESLAIMGIRSGHEKIDDGFVDSPYLPTPLLPPTIPPGYRSVRAVCKRIGSMEFSFCDCAGCRRP